MSVEVLTITNQHQLDEAVMRALALRDADSATELIVVDAPQHDVLRVAATKPVLVRTTGRTRLEAAGRHVTVEALGRSAVLARGAVVFASEDATVQACGQAIVMAEGRSTVRATAGVEAVAVGPHATVEQDSPEAAERGVWAPQGAVLLAAPVTDATCIAYPVEGSGGRMAVTPAERDRLTHAGEDLGVPGQAAADAPGADMTVLPEGWMLVDGAEPPVIVYGNEHCPGCRATERALTRSGITYVKVDLADLDPEEYARVTDGHLQAPVVVAPTGQAWSGHRPTLLEHLRAPESTGPAL